uniref:Nose resistant-to-fluoxetine protein N-terminal domain-containing protein n=1 Tax=Glossina brevipalpis TaxID=37001 RepID=A0A1A9W8H9_9MUSC
MRVKRMCWCWCPLYLILNILFTSCYALEKATVSRPTCNLKNNCNLSEQMLSMGGAENVERSSNDLENNIATIFEDKINYSLKLFADQTVIDYKALERNLSDLAANLTIAHIREDIDIEESEKKYVNNIAQRFISWSQPFDASRNPLASELCRRHTKRYLEGLHNFDLWALKMHDSIGKLSSGILNGNINQHGDFDECLSIKHQHRQRQRQQQQQRQRQRFSNKIPSVNDHDTADDEGNDDDYDDENDEIKGKYCLAYAQPILPHKSKRLQTFFKLVQSHGPFKSEFNDPGHRVPRYSLINWGICVPSSCTHKDVEYAVKEFLNNMTVSTGITFNVRVEPQMCTYKETKPWDRNTTWAVRFFIAIACLSILSTIYNRCTQNNAKENQNEWLTVFALDKNWKWIFEIKFTNDDVRTVHGIRFLNAVMLLLSHKSMAMFFNPYNNRTGMSESLGRPWTVIGRAASLYTDPFLLVSGMLTAYSLLGRLKKGQPVRLKNEYISRLIRIVPPLAALILFCTYVLPIIGSGPQWNLVVGHHATICKQHWWRNLLFIHNYFGFSEMCLTHTHHLGIDTELFIVAPIIILLLWKWPRNGFIILLTLCGIGTAARYYTTIVNELSNYIYFGTNIKRLFRTADYMYSFPPMRSTVYIMGIFLGYILRMYPNVKLSNTQLRLGWFAALACLVASVLGPAPMGDISYEYNSTHAAIYAAFAPIAWCLFFCWIVFVSHNGYKNRITRFFSWKYYQISTKLSYAIYLTQFPIYFYNVGRRRHAHHYYNFISAICDTNEYLCILAASIILTLLFDAPFQNMKKLLLKRSSRNSSSSKINSDSSNEINPSTEKIKLDLAELKLTKSLVHSHAD